MRFRIRNLAALALVLAVSSCDAPLGPNDLAVYALQSLEAKPLPVSTNPPLANSSTDLGDTIRVDRSGAGTWDWHVMLDQGLDPPALLTITFHVQFKGQPMVAREVSRRRCLQLLLGEWSCNDMSSLSVVPRPGGFDVYSERGRLTFLRIGTERH
jgi:hypothetical protein